MKAKVLLTGGLGFIGSHSAVEFINAGYDVVIVDDRSNSKAEVLGNIKKITGVFPAFYKINIATDSFDKVFEEHPDIYAVVHYAGYKSVGESVKNPLMYYENNLYSTMKLLSTMKKYNVHNIVFSSSATVYDSSEMYPFHEESATGNCTNPYGWTKYMNERIIEDTVKSWDSYKSIILRYFNPIGAHESGLIGENPNGIPNNLVPYIAQVATGIREELSVYGNDYSTPDGTGIRDYIHVVDLANAHVKAVDNMINTVSSFSTVYNVGTGVGYSVLDVIESYSRVNNVDVKYKIVGRRDGDVAVSYSDNLKIRKELNWEPKHNLDDMCRDSYNYQIKSK